MGKSLPSAATKLLAIARSGSSRSRPSRFAKPPSEFALRQPDARRVPSPAVATTSSRERRGREDRRMEGGGGGGEERRTPLAEVVADCVKRWFQDTLREAKLGDTGMQVLVGQMYTSGYGIPKNPQKGKAWITKASKYRSSAWKVSDKPPGYNASESDSDDVKGDLK
ncbi:hypothetical protein QJS10_CPB20g00190 [Acorus calamus]|uniref:Uncharacterized protein n=1 Tax=Acorus calamus TaxID=4465 RepID=A0AAV9C790_ACOCL|nr:hypothetical protein QJS10_CPB20g00190 [Acorus calamus]